MEISNEMPGGFSSEAALELTTELQISARDRYDLDDEELIEARIVGYVLQGDKAVMEYMQRRYDDGFDRWDFINPCLWSLLETVLLWYRHHERGALKPHIPKPAPVGTPIPILALRDFLVTMDMYGDDTEYEYASQTPTLTGDMRLLPGWTIRRLAELYALAETVSSNVSTIQERKPVWESNALPGQPQFRTAKIQAGMPESITV